MCNNTSKPALDWGKPLQTMDGQDAKLVSDNYRTFEGPKRLVQVEFLNCSASYLYDKYGIPVMVNPLNLSSGLILRNKTRKVTKWYNLYKLVPGAEYYNSESVARSHISIPHQHLATLSIEIEEPL